MVSSRSLGPLAALVIFNVVLSTSFQDALFLAHHARDRIPPAMLFGSLLTAGTSLAVTRLLRRKPQALALRLLLFALCALSAGFALWNVRPGPTSTFALFLFVELSTTLGVAATWSYFQAPLDAAQIRRLMPRLGTWAGVGGLLAGAVIPLWLRRMHHPQALVILSALAWGAAALLVRGGHVLRAPTRGRHEAAGLRQIWRLPLFRWMAVGTGGILWMGLLVQYETRVALQQQLSPSAIAQTMGGLMAVTSVTGIAVQGLLTTPILERWGVGLALAVLPMCVAVLLGLYVPMPAYWGLLAAAFFVDKTLRPNLHRPAESCMLASLSPAVRPALALALGSIVGPLIKAVGALLLWGAATAVPNSYILVMALLITLSLAALSTRWGRIYERTLRDTLEEGSVDMLGEDAEDEALVPLIDGPRLEILVQALVKGSPRSRELALEMLRPHRSSLVHRAMKDLLGHADPGVRIAALRWFAAEPDPELLEALRARWAAPQEALPPEERVALLQAAGPWATVLLGEGADLERWLAAKDVGLRSAVIDALLDSGDAALQERARRAMRDLLGGEAQAERIAGVRLLAEHHDESLLPVALELLRGDAVAVRREVLRCLPSLGGAAARAPLWAALSDKELAHGAARALAACGEPVVPEIARALPGSGAAERLHLLRALGMIPSSLCAPVLMAWLEQAPLEALRSLTHLRRLGTWQPGAQEREQIEAYLLQDLRYGLRLRQSREILRRQRLRTSLVLRELDAQVDGAQQRVFRALSLLVPPDALSPVFNSLRGTSSPYRDQARELLRTLVRSGPLCAGSLHILDETLPFTEECYRPPLDVFSERTVEAAVGWLLSTRDPWILAALRHDPGHEVGEAEAQPQGLEDPMQASLDILLFLKDVALFEALTNQQLVEVAQLAEKVELAPGVALFQQGDMPDYLYLVRKGKLIVKQAGQELARLGTGECVGEMAVLADTERTATVVTAEPCQLLRFEANVFMDLLDTYPEIGRGLLKSLVRRLAQTGARKGVRPATMTGMVWSGGAPIAKPERTGT